MADPGTWENDRFKHCLFTQLGSDFRKVGTDFLPFAVHNMTGIALAGCRKDLLAVANVAFQLGQLSQ